MQLKDKTKGKTLLFLCLLKILLFVIIIIIFPLFSCALSVPFFFFLLLLQNHQYKWFFFFFKSLLIFERVEFLFVFTSSKNTRNWQNWFCENFMAFLFSYFSTYCNNKNSKYYLLLLQLIYYYYYYCCYFSAPSYSANVNINMHTDILISIYQ